MPLPALLGAALASPVIGGVINGISSIFTNKSNENINERNLQWQTEQNALNRNFEEGQQGRALGFQNYWNQKSLDWQEKMWNLQNQYNTPSAMMERYNQAGLNPYLNGLSQMGSGAGAAQAPPQASTNNSAPVGTPVMAGSPNAIPMQAPRFDILGAMGVSANVANQNADTLQKKWSIYNSILENGDRATAKKFLSANPDMMSDADPENSLYYKRWLRADMQASIDADRSQWEYSLRQMYGVKQAEKELYKVQKECDDLDSLMSKRKWDIDEIKHKLNLIDEQIRSEKSVQSKNYSEAGLANAKAETENAARQYVVKQLLLNTNILDFDEQSKRAVFESKESLRGWLTSSEAKEAFAKAARMHGLSDADKYRFVILDFLDHMPFTAGATVSKSE